MYRVPTHPWMSLKVLEFQHQKIVGTRNVEVDCLLFSVETVQRQFIGVDRGRKPVPDDWSVDHKTSSAEHLGICSWYSNVATSCNRCIVPCLQWSRSHLIIFIFWTYGRQTVPDWGVVRSCNPLQNFGGSSHITGTAEPKVVRFCTRVGCINSNGRMTYHQ